MIAVSWRKGELLHGKKERPACYLYDYVPVSAVILNKKTDNTLSHYLIMIIKIPYGHIIR